MTLYRTRRTQWLYCQRTLRELLPRSTAHEAAEINARLKLNQRYMSFERRINQLPGGMA